MSDREHSSGYNDELLRLIATLHETQKRIEELTAGTVDSVMSATGSHNLLPVTQEQLLESEATQRRFASEREAVLDALPANIALLDPGGRIVAVNLPWRQFTSTNGLSGHQFRVGMNYVEMCEKAAADGSDFGLALASQLRTILNGESDHIQLEYPCHSSDGEKWFQILARSLPKKSGHGAVVMHLDITERKRALVETDVVRRGLETLIRKAPIGICVHRDFKPIVANEEFLRIYGFSEAEMQDLPDIRDILAEDEKKKIAEVCPRSPSPASGDDNVIRFKGKRRDGKLIAVEWIEFPIVWREDIAICVIVSDVMHLRSLEEKLQQAQRLDALGQLTGGVAHDFNNLLAVILANAEMLVDTLPGDNRLRPLAILTKLAAERGAELTGRLLAFARQQPLQPKAIGIGDLLTGMADMIQRVLGENVEINMILAEDLCPVLADATQLESALLNLCINARDAMPNGGRITISSRNIELNESDVGLHADVRAGRYVMITVSDNGTGMSPDVIEHAFDPFFTTKEIGKGTGLGLSMVYGFVKQSEGHISVDSAVGHGTTISIYLPQVLDKQASEQPAHVLAKVAAGGGEKILVVEDDDLVRESVIEHLRSLGYSVASASNAREALHVLKDDASIDLLFTDIVMPGGMNGLQLADKALELSQELLVLFTSGYSEEILARSGRRDPNLNLLPKPYSYKHLVDKVRATLDGKRGRDSLTKS